MLTTLISLLIIGLVLWLIYFIIGKFVSGTPYQIIGIILALIFLLYALSALHLLPGVGAL